MRRTFIFHATRLIMLANPAHGKWVDRRITDEDDVICPHCRGDIDATEGVVNDILIARRNFFMELRDHESVNEETFSEWTDQVNGRFHMIAPERWDRAHRPP